MDNSNNLSSAKTVTAENTNEKENEQMEAAPVINKSYNVENTMEGKTFQAPQDGADETELRSRAEETTVESVNEFANAAQVSTIACTEMVTESTVMTPMLPTQVLLRPIYRYRELCKYGFKPSYLKVN